MNEGTAPKGKRRWIGIILLVLGVVVLAAYPIAVSLFIAAGGVPKLFSGTDTVAVTVRKGWSFWPGRVHVEGVRVTMQDRNVQFALTIEEADVTIDLLAFTRRTFHATKVRGTGVAFRFRHRIEHEAQGLPFVAALPPIAEFDDPPLREFGPPAAPLDEANYDLWTVHFDDVDVAVTELWMQMMRYQGDARVAGAFRLRPAKRLWVGPAKLLFRDGILTTGHHDILSGMRGALHCKVDDFDVEPVTGMEPFRFISARLQLEAGVANLDALNFLTEPSPAFDLEDGSGLLDIDATIDHGVLTRDTRFNYRTAHVGVDNDDLPFRLDGEVAVIGSGPVGESGAQVQLTIPQANLVVPSIKRKPPRLRNVAVELGSSNADVTKDFPLVKSRATFEDISLRDLRWLDELPFGRPRSVKIKGGVGRLGGAVALQQPSQAIDASVSIGFADAIITSEAGKITGTADVLVTGHVGVDRAATLKGHAVTDKIELVTEGFVATLLGRGVLDADLAVSPRGTLVGEMRAETGEWIGDVGTSRFSGAALSGSARFEPEAITASATAEGMGTSTIGACPWAQADRAKIAARIETPDSGDPRGGILASLEGASVRWGGFEARAAEAALHGNWTPTSLNGKLDGNRVSMKSAGGAPRGWEAEVGSVALAAELALGEKRAQGPAQLEIRNATAKIGKTQVRGDLMAALTLSSPKDAFKTADVSGQIQARNVVVATKQRTIDGWWADFQLDRARLDIRENFDVAGNVKARFRDGLPALYVLASEDEIPGFVPTIAPLEGLMLDLHVERYCRWTDVQIQDARGGPFTAEGRVQIEPGETRGAVLVRLSAIKPLSLGLHFVEDYSDIAPLVGGSWLEKRLVPLTTAATAKHDKKCVPQPSTCE